MDVDNPSFLKRSLGYPDEGKAPTSSHEYVRLLLATCGFPFKAEQGGILDLAHDLLENYQERIRLLRGVHSPIARRVETFLNNHFSDVLPQAQGQKLALPATTFVLPAHGIARTLSLPMNSNASKNEYVTSHRLMQGVLHNPKSDKRTTVGSFHIVEGGLTITDDKYRVPRLVGANLFYSALHPPSDDLKIPYTIGEASLDVPCPPLSLYMRPIVRPAIPGLCPLRSMETLVLAPGALASNLDFLESVFGNAGDPFLPENDAALNPDSWTGHTGLILLAPHLTKLTKKSLGLPHINEATELQKKQSMCWENEDELYNDGRAFKVTVRTNEGIICTVIADNYFGYCKKEVKTQISFSANLGGLAEEEHSGGTLAYPKYSFGVEFDGIGETKRWKYLKDYTYEDTLRVLGDRVTINESEGYAVDKVYPDVYYIPENAHFSVVTNLLTYEYKGVMKTLKINPKLSYVLPSGFHIHMEHHPRQSVWRLVGTEGRVLNLHKPCTVSGGGKSELAKSISGTMIYGTVYVADPIVDFQYVDEILFYPDYPKRFKKEKTNRKDPRTLLSSERSLGSTIEMLTPSILFTDDYNDWVKHFPSHILPIVYYVKRFYDPVWKDDWKSHFSMDLINGTNGHELKFGNRLLSAAYLRVGFTKEGIWRTYKVRTDYMPTEKIQTEDDISASMVVPTSHFPFFTAPFPHITSAKVSVNCEFRLFQRPDDCIYKGQDSQCEWDIAQYGNFLANFQPLTPKDADDLVTDVSEYVKFTKPMKKLVQRATELKEGEYFACSSETRIVGDGKRTANPRYLQVRPDVVNHRSTYLANVSSHLYYHMDVTKPLVLPVDVLLIGRRVSKPSPGLPNLAVYNPIHYQDLPEFLMDIICGMSGTSPSTTGAGSEGALTKGPFNAIPFTADINSLLLSCALCGLGGWSTPTGYIGPNIAFAHDSSVLTPEIFCRMRPEERDPDYLVENGFIERMKDFDYNGHSVLASRLGYRITERFSHFLGRVFDFPQIFDEAILRPETQSMESFVNGVDELVTAQKVVAERYFRDGTVKFASPPVAALLHIMAYGEYEGKTLNCPEIRDMFKRENILKSDWYHSRLRNQQKKDILKTTKDIDYITNYIAVPKNQIIVARLKLNERLNKCKEDLEYYQSSKYLESLYGSIGCDLLEDQ